MRIKSIALAAISFILSASVNAAPITSLEITDGNFFIGGENLTLTPAAYASMNIDGVSYHGSEPTTLGSEESYFSTSVATTTHSLLGVISIYTSDSPFEGVNGLFSAPSGNINHETSELTLDLSSWTFFNNGVSISHNIGSSSNLVEGTICVDSFSSNCTSPITTTYNALTGEFTASWVSFINHGALPGAQTSTYITGYVSAVPVPAAVWLFGSGLLGLVGLARRNKGN